MEKQRWGESEKRRKEVRRSEKRQVREKVRKSRFTVCFPMIRGSGGSKSRLAKAAGAEPCGQTRDEKLHAVVTRSTFGSEQVKSTSCLEHFWKWRCRKKCTPLWREARFQVKMYKAHQRRTTFGSWDVEKVHAIVARSTFPSQNVQSTSTSDHFWKLRCWKKRTQLWREAHFQVKRVKNWRASDHFCKLRCRKSARRCGAKHISKSKCTKHINVGPLLEVEMSKKCTPFWREGHFQVKHVNNWSASDHF